MMGVSVDVGDCGYVYNSKYCNFKAQMASEADDHLNPQTKKRTLTLIFDILLRNPTLCVSINKYIYIIPSKQLSFLAVFFSLQSTRYMFQHFWAILTCYYVRFF